MSRFPDACYLTAAYFSSDGSCRWEHCPLVLFYCSSLSLPFGGLCPWCRSHVLGTFETTWDDDASQEDDNDAGSFICRLKHPSRESQEARLFHLALRAMSVLSLEAESAVTEQFERQLFVTMTRMPRLSGCLVGDGEESSLQPFGTTVKHWRRLWQCCRAANVVVFLTASSRFYVISAKTRCDPHVVDSRSALCWIRQKCGHGFLAGDHGVFYLQVSRKPCAEDVDTTDLPLAKEMEEAFEHVSWQ